ncbi:MAG: AAA family ATPase [Candidatus Thiodiazotropha taylori]
MVAKKYEQGWGVRRMKTPTPLVLKRLLIEHSLSQRALRDAMTLHTGSPPSPSTVSQILNRNIWPERSPKQFLKKQIQDFLRDNGIPDEEIKTALKIDSDPDNPRSAPPSTKSGIDRIATPAIEENQLPETEMLSQQARKHFQLFLDPFLDDIQGPDDVFLDSEQRYIRESMYQASKHAGFLAVIGESGAGKTTLRKDLIDRIQRENSPITVIQPRIIDKGRLSAGAICDAIINDASQEKPMRTLESKARQIEVALAGSSRAGNTHVLIIEEAHDLSVATLKYLKRFWELEDGFKRLLGIILIGQTELKNRLDERTNFEAREVIRRCEVAELRPLNGNLEDYLSLKFHRVGKSKEDIFEPDSYDAIRDRLVQRKRGSSQMISMMYPLVVNNAVRKAMNVAADIGHPKVNADIIKGV